MGKKKVKAVNKKSMDSAMLFAFDYQYEECELGGFT